MGSEIIRAGGFSGTPASIVIDVYDEANPGTLLATIPNGDISQIGSEDIWICDLRAITPNIGLPEDGAVEQKSFTFIWRDDAGTRLSHAHEVHGVDARLEVSRRYRRETPIYPSTTVPLRGITQNVIDAGLPSYVKVEVAADLDFATPPATYYDVYTYDSSGRIATRTPALTPPSP